MLFDTLNQGSSKKSLLEGGGRLASKKMKSFRRKRMELRRVRSISLEYSDDNPFINCSKRRSETKLAENVLSVPVDGEKCLSHGKISVIGRRREMEDAVAVELGFVKKGGKSYDFFGVYDGHGGSRVAQECSEMLHKVLAGIVEEDNCQEIDWEKTVAAGFKKMDEEVNKGGTAVATMGSTAVVAVVGKEEVVVANCGDSRAVLSCGGVVMQLSDDHKPNRADELDRIEKSGGKVINWNGERVLGVLATSRSIGDNYLKPYVIAEPEVRVMNRNDKDEFMILASDGLWDVVSNDVACQVVRRCLDGQIRRKSDSNPTVEAAAVLAEMAMGRGSRDNITVIVVAFS